MRMVLGTCWRALLAGVLCVLALAGQTPLPKDCIIFSTGFSAFRVLDANWNTIADQGYSYTPSLDREGFVSGDPVDERGFMYSRRFSRNVSTEVFRWGYYATSTAPFRYSPPWRIEIASIPGVNPFRIMTTRDAVWLLHLYDGMLTRLDKDQPTQTPAPRGFVLPPGYGRILGACTNGRELFFAAKFPYPSNVTDIFVVDLRDPFLAVQHFAPVLVPPGPSESYVKLMIGRDGTLYAAYDVQTIDEIDPVTAMVTATHCVAGASTLAYDVWSDRAVVYWPIPFGTSLAWAYLHAQPSTWTVSYQSPFIYTLFHPYDYLASGLVFTNEQPFEHFGQGCTNGLGREPRMGWQGLPLQGQSFSLTLRDAEPNGFAFFWLGLSDTYWAGVGALPIDGARFGAPGCLLWVAADVAFPVPTDGAGRAALVKGVPVNPALSGWEIYAQTASSSSSNALGFAASDALAVRLR